MKIQTFCKSVGEGACLALCYIRAALGEKATPTMMFDALWQAARNNIIDAADDCFVNDAVALMKLVSPNKKFEVVKQKIASLDDLKGHQLAAVKYKHCFSHWVLTYNGEIIFDSLDNSQSVKYGKPVDARIIKMEDM